MWIFLPEPVIWTLAVSLALSLPLAIVCTFLTIVFVRDGKQDPPAT